MNTKELLDSILKDWSIEWEAYEESKFSYHGFPNSQNLYGNFFIRKNFKKNERFLIHKEILILLIRKRGLERDKFHSEHKTSPISKEEYIKSHERYSGLSRLFEYMLWPGAYLTDFELLEILEFPRKPMNITLIENNENKIVNLNSAYFYLGYILKIAKYYKSSQPLSKEHISILESYKDLDEIKSFHLHQKALDEILLTPNSVSVNHPTQETKGIKKIGTDKKWKWLQEHPLDFISDKSFFFELLENLSEIDYHDRFEINEAIQVSINRINSLKFENFLLDLHKLTKTEPGKRSAWFMREKVNVYKILVWLLFHLKTPNRFSILEEIAEKCFQKIPRIGPTSRILGDEILKLLYESQTIEGLGSLLKLKTRNKYPIFREQLDFAITLAARYSRLSPNDVEDYFISDYGIVNGELNKSFGDYNSKLVINNIEEVKLTWTKGEKVLKRPPSSLKNDYAEEIKTWNSKIKAIKKEISGQKNRVESFFTKKKEWSYANWKKYFFEHPILGLITKKLIWTFKTESQTQNAFFLNGVFIDCSKKEILNIENSIVTLWHPALSKSTEVENWRNLMVINKVKQPFKQAYREVYLVTEAEIKTSTFSNRFSNHLLRQHKFIALAQQRLWKYSFSDLFSGGESPNIIFPDHNIKCVFKLEGEYDLARTRQIQFLNEKNNEPIKIEEIPLLVFSESMRDVDLFVAISTIGIEEEWHETRFREYWRNYSSRALSNSAEVRRSAIQSIFSKLQNKEKFDISERFLRVFGDKRTYKIHFSSGNILMEPNDQFLCIVPDRKKIIKDNLFLPFDGDPLLDLIVSKALLLANDKSIKDPDILSQINKK